MARKAVQYFDGLFVHSIRTGFVRRLAARYSHFVDLFADATTLHDDRQFVLSALLLHGAQWGSNLFGPPDDFRTVYFG